MASVQIEVEGCDDELKHLGFVRTLAINAATFVANLYNSAKQNSGALKSTVEKAENAVTAVVSPVYDRLKGVPGDILVSLDKKVDKAASKLEECAPPAAKSVFFEAQSIVKKASDLVHGSAEEAKAAICHAAGKRSERIKYGG